MRYIAVLCILQTAVTCSTVNHVAGENAGASSYLLALRRGMEERKQGSYRSAVRDFEVAIRLASNARNSKDEAEAMNKQSVCFILLFQYRQALAIATSAADLGRALHDDEVIGTAENNRATIFEQLGDLTLAESASREAVDHLKITSNKNKLAAAVTNHGDILAISGRTDEAMQEFKRAIALASEARATDTEAMAQDRMGEALLDKGDQSAEAPLKRAYDLFKASGDQTSAALTLFELSVLAKIRGDYRGALKILDSAEASDGLVVGALAPFFEPKLRGECLLGLHREREALGEFEKSVRRAGEWRRSSLPSDASSTKTLVVLHDVYRNYISLAADLAIHEHDPALSRRALSVLMAHRASTLREQMVATLGKQMTLPPRYFELLSQIQGGQAAVTLGSGKDLPAKRAALQRLQDQLVDVENQVGLAGPNLVAKANETGTQALGRVQKSLLRQELLLSFFLGKEKSYVWAVTDDKVSVYELPAESVIAAHAKAFAQDARKGSNISSGDILWQDLLEKLEPEFRNRPEWVVAADGALLDGVPFSALPERAGSSATLEVAHSIRFTPSELLLTTPSTSAQNSDFVGIADPIYNLADNRLAAGNTTSRPVKRPRVGLTLARLVASEREVHIASHDTGFSRVNLLSGATATGQRLREELAVAPEVLHFAVHVVSPEGPDGVRGEEAGLALSLGPDGVPQLLTKEFISTLRVPGTLVVLSGCASQQGKPLPGAGMIGLSRAWLLAGASAVLVTAWPTPDDSGKFFEDFYKHLQNQPKTQYIARRAAAALQATQIEMQHSPGYMSDPSFWAAYSLISKE